MTYDAQSLALAEHFLQDYKVGPKGRAAVADQLAKVIQRAVEDELDRMKDEKLITEGGA